MILWKMFHLFLSKTVLDPIDIFKNIFFWAPQIKDSHTGLKQHEGEQMMIYY